MKEEQEEVEGSMNFKPPISVQTGIMLINIDLRVRVAGNR